MPPPRPPGVTPHDLAPGDQRANDFDFAGFDFETVVSPDDPQFDTAYACLWDAFGDQGEMETRAVIAGRLAWRARRPTPRGYALQYELVLVRRAGTPAAVADYTAIVDTRRPDASVVVHLSHVWVAPPQRRTGLSAWLRALPLRTARQCLAELGMAPRPVTLVGETEPADPAVPERVGRLVAFEKAGFRKVDPRSVTYLQPDFRPPATIDAAGGPTPVPLSLVVRRVGREDEGTMAGPELRAVVTALYAMYAEGFRPADMRPNWDSLEHYPADDALIDLVPPSVL